MQLMEGKTFHPEPAAKRCNRFVRQHNAVGCALLTPRPCRPGIQPPCVPTRPGIVAPSSWKDGCVAGRCYALGSYSQIELRPAQDAQRESRLGKYFLVPIAEIVWIIPFTPYLMWRRVGLLIYVSRLGNVIILRKVICGNHKLKLNKNISEYSMLWYSSRWFWIINCPSRLYSEGLISYRLAIRLLLYVF